jgi:hypothetical protein
MAYATHRDPSRGLDVTVAAGTITRDDMMEHVRGQVADPQWPAGPLSLADFRLVEVLDLTLEDISDAARLYAPKVHHLANHKTAYLRSPAFRGAVVLERAFSRHYGMGPVEFADVESACRWLGIDAAIAERVIEDLRRELGVSDD